MKYFPILLQWQLARELSPEQGSFAALEVKNTLISIASQTFAACWVSGAGGYLCLCTGRQDVV